MTDPLENEPTQQLPAPSVEARLTSIEATLAMQTALLNKLDAKMDMLIKMQQEMYVDLRKRIADLNDPLGTLTATVHQIQRDIQPDSFQNRLMRMS